MGFGMPKKEKGRGKFKPKLIGSIIGTIFFGILAIYSGINVLTGEDKNTVEGTAYNIQGDKIILVFSIGFAGGFAYWGFANFKERQKVRADRQKSKEKKSNQHKKKEKKDDEE